MLKAVLNNQTFERKYWLTFTSEIIKTTANKPYCTALASSIVCLVILLKAFLCLKGPNGN